MNPPRQLEYNFLIWLRQFDVRIGDIKYDGQFIWIAK